MTWSLRVSRWDALDLNERDIEYLVHAAARIDGTIVTRCGRRLIRGPNEHGEETLVTCMNCDRLLHHDSHKPH